MVKERDIKCKLLPCPACEGKGLAYDVDGNPGAAFCQYCNGEGKILKIGIPKKFKKYKVNLTWWSFKTSKKKPLLPNGYPGEDGITL